jgi:hypothetical protein
MKSIQTIFTFIILAFLATPQTTLAHGGKEHGPLSAMAPQGGMIKEIKNGHIELVTKDNTVELYHYDLDIKPSQVKGVKIKAEYSLPRKPYKELKLKPHLNHWSAPYSKDASHRYNLKIKIDDEMVEWVID